MFEELFKKYYTISYQIHHIFFKKGEIDIYIS
jgi:hypothetical protein